MIQKQKKEPPKHKLIIESSTKEIFETWLAARFQWNGTGWVASDSSSSMVMDTKFLYKMFMTEFYPGLSLLEVNQLAQDIAFVQSILPDHYLIQESKRKGSIHCKSPIGIKHKVDADDDEHWDYIMMALRHHFGKRLQEVDHNTCFCHVDFTIYLSK